MAQRDVVLIQSEEYTVDISTDGGTTVLPLVGAASIDESGGDAETRQVVDFADNATAVTGKPRIPSVSIAINKYAPHHSVSRTLKSAKDNGTSVNVRYTSLERQVYLATRTTDTIAVAVGGEVTWAETPAVSGRPDPASARFQVGLLIKAGSNNYVVDSINADGTTVMVRNSDNTAVTTALVATMDYEFAIPAVRRPFYLARITNFDVVSIGEQSNATCSLELQPDNFLPDWEVVTS